MELTPPGTVLIVLLMASSTIFIIQVDASRMKKIPLRTDRITVSGHSSGAVAATQFYLSHSHLIDGIAVFSTMQYACGGGSGSLVRLVPCLRGRRNISESVDKAREFAHNELIDPLENLKNNNHYIHHGKRDVIINVDNGINAFEFFKQFSNSTVLHLSDTHHAVPTKYCGIHCQYGTVGTGCSKCGFSVVFEGLNYVFNGTLTEPPVTSCRAAETNHGLTMVDQSEFLFPFDNKVSMHPEAVLYTPPRCRANSSLCALHVAYHGCRHSIQNDGMDYIKCSGYVEVADANDLIVLFPQVKQTFSQSASFFQCWDLHGYSGPLYGTKMGSQNQVVYNMIRRIMHGYEHNTQKNWMPLNVPVMPEDEDDEHEIHS